MSGRALLAWLAALAAVGAVARQAARPPGAEYDGAAFTFHKVRDGIFHAVGTGNLTVGCNAAVIVNADDVLVVDSHISPAAGWALVKEIGTLTPKPVRYVVNTHFHFDHVHGNQVYPPGVEIIGHEFTRAMVVDGRSRSGRSYDFFVGGLPARTAALKEQLAAAADPGARTKLETQLEVLERHIAATGAVVPTPPTVTLSESLTLYRGGREIRLLFLGRGHTGGDVVVFLPGERMIVTGDLLLPGSPYLGDAYVPEWIDTLERVKRLEFDVVLPGHGQAFQGKERIGYLQAYLRDFWTQAQALHRDGVSADEAARRIDMRSHAPHYPDIRDAGVFPHGVQRAYELLDGRAH